MDDIKFVIHFYIEGNDIIEYTEKTFLMVIKKWVRKQTKIRFINLQFYENSLTMNKVRNERVGLIRRVCDFLYAL